MYVAALDFAECLKRLRTVTDWPDHRHDHKVSIRVSGSSLYSDFSIGLNNMFVSLYKVARR